MASPLGGGTAAVVTPILAPKPKAAAASPASAVSAAESSASSTAGGGSTHENNDQDRNARSARRDSDSTSTTLTTKELELQRKRARDRKSQQAMRDRTKWTISNLNKQVSFLTQVVTDRTRDLHLLNSRMHLLETENAQLRTQNAALQLSLMGSQRIDDLSDPAITLAAAMSKAEIIKEPWEIPPIDGPPTCLSDQILQGFIASKVHQRNGEGALTFGVRPNLCSLLDKDRRTSDAISDIVGDIVRSYFEIDTLPKKVAVFYILCSLLKWMILLDKTSWESMPPWLRPTEAQITTSHAAWIDRIPWPTARDYLISHPEITLDHFAAVYSTSFSVRWPYDPSHVLINAAADDGDITINPVYEEHIRQLRNWDVGKPFRDRYPQMVELIDNDAKNKDYVSSMALEYHQP